MLLQGNYKIAIVGATGQVGSTLLKLLAEHQVAAQHIVIVASERSAGKRISYKDATLIVEPLATFDFSKVQCAFFAAGSDIAKQYAPIAAQQGCYVIDKSSFYRMQPDIPLIVPGVNDALLKNYSGKIIAVPNCSTVPLVTALKPLHNFYGIERVNVATYQAVSGAGLQGMQELERQIQAYAHQQAVPAPQKFIAPIAFNVIPMIDNLLASGYTKEEMKMHDETGKIFQDNNIIVNATTVRVPVWIGHSEAVTVKTHKPFALKEIISAWQSMTSLKVLQDDIATPLTHAANNNDIWISRVRRHPNDDQNYLTFWLTTDNLRKGAALTAWEIASRL